MQGACNDTLPSGIGKHPLGINCGMRFGSDALHGAGNAASARAKAAHTCNLFCTGTGIVDARMYSGAPVTENIPAYVRPIP